MVSTTTATAAGHEAMATARHQPLPLNILVFPHSQLPAGGLDSQCPSVTQTICEESEPFVTMVLQLIILLTESGKGLPREPEIS